MAVMQILGRSSRLPLKFSLNRSSFNELLLNYVPFFESLKSCTANFSSTGLFLSLELYLSDSLLSIYLANQIFHMISN